MAVALLVAQPVQADAEEPISLFPLNKVSILNKAGLQINQTNQEQLQSSQVAEEHYEIIEEARKSDNGTILAQERHKLGYNCVFYVKDQVEVPQGMYNLQNKIDIINSHEPIEGSVAITDEGPVGHMALVLHVLEDGIVIEEGNYIRGYKTIRKIGKDLPLGYYIPIDNKGKV